MECDSLSGSERINCFAASLSYKLNEEERAGLWSCVRDEYVKGGGTEEELFKKANKGFVADPTGSRLFMDDPAGLEWQEKLELAYSDPRFYHCISKSGLPLPFAVNDFNAGMVEDDQWRYEINSTVDKIKGELKKEQQKFSPDSNEYRIELARRIYNWALKSFKFYSDCKIECTDYEALSYKQGRCTESSAAVYYAYKYAGLNPTFLFFHDLKPSLDWINILPRLGEAVDHVFIGIPLKNGTLIHIDLINRRFDARYGFAVELSERNFASYWLHNKGASLYEMGRYKDAEKVYKLILAIAPEWPTPYISLLELYKRQNNTYDYDAVASAMDKLFGDNPYILFAKEFIKAAYSEDSSGQLEALNKRLDELGVKDPYLAAHAHYFVARDLMPKFIEKHLRVSAARQKGAVVDKGFQDNVEDSFNQVVNHYAKSLLLDPNFVFAFRDVDTLFDNTASFGAAVDFFDILIAKHRDHAPFLYAAALHRCHLAQTVKGPGEQKRLLNEALDYSEKLVKTEPNHPSAYEIRGMVYFLRMEYSSAIKDFEKAIGLYNSRSDSDKSISLNSYSNLLGAYINNSDKEGALKILNSIIKYYPQDGPVSVSNYILNNIFWYFSAPIKNYISDELEEMPEAVLEWSENFIEAVGAICERLQIYQSNREAVDTVRAYFLPFVAVVVGADDAATWLEKISDKSSIKIQDGLARGLNQTSAVLFADTVGLKGDYYEELEEFFEEIEPVVFGLTKEAALLKAMIGLVRGYILAEDKKEAARLLKKALAMAPSADVVALFGGGVVDDIYKKGGGTKKNTTRLLTALDLVWENRALLSPEVRAKFSEYYDNAAILCEGHEMKEEAELANGRAQELGK